MYVISFIIILCVFIAVLLVSVVLLIFGNKNLKSDISKLNVALKRVRYGDVNIRLNNLKDTNVENSANRLFETISDREIMIKEYQSTLADKNLSLEKIIENEKQLQLFKDEFTATLTHDMKVPVIAELNSINYLLDGRFGELNQKQKDILNLMKISNQELKDLIENLVETYKIEQKALELNLTFNNFNEFILSTVNEMQPISNNTGHVIQTDLSSTNDIKFYFDFFQFKRVIKNLIHNAISYSPKNTDIFIKTRCKDDNVEFEIKNNGAGISTDDLKFIFQKYYSGHSKLKKSGTGLGLYLSQQIMLAHKGNISLQNSENGYTTFVISIPKKTEL